jgi:hypothetical protein
VTTPKQIQRAALRAAGVGRGGRADAGIRTDRTAPPGTHYAYCADERRWHSSDVPIGDLLDVTEITPDLYAGGAVLDLYVYDTEELVTNVCAVISARGELLACFDSVSTRGMEWSTWWLEGTACACEACREVSA